MAGAAGPSQWQGRPRPARAEAPKKGDPRDPMPRRSGSSPGDIDPRTRPASGSSGRPIDVAAAVRVAGSAGPAGTLGGPSVGRGRGVGEVEHVGTPSRSWGRHVVVAGGRHPSRHGPKDAWLWLR